MAREFSVLSGSLLFKTSNSRIYLKDNWSCLKENHTFVIIPGRRSCLSGVAGATCPDRRSHPVLIDGYLARDGSRP